MPRKEFPEGSMKNVRPVNIKIYSRAVVAIILITAWSILSLTGLLLWLAPSGQRSGQMELLFNLTKSEWGDVHFWIAVATLVITIIHIIIDWRALRGVIRYLTSTHRNTRVIPG
jgi:hypothetical protein